MKVLQIPAKGRPFFTEMENDLHAMQKAVDGFIEIVRPRGLPQKLVMVIDDEGKLKDKPVNRICSALYDHPYDVIVGDAFICGEGIVDGEPDLIGLTSTDVAWLIPTLDLDTY